MHTFDISNLNPQSMEPGHSVSVSIALKFRGKLIMLMNNKKTDEKTKISGRICNCQFSLSVRTGTGFEVY